MPHMAAAKKMSPRGLAWAGCAGLLLGLPGCTICPDPFDYSGPVPNGSAPQNDFRARSNGIAPLGGVPRPWPPVVRVFPERTEEPLVTAPIAERVESAEPETIDAAADAEPIILPAAVETEAAPGPASAADAAVVEEPALDDILPPVRPATHPPAAPLSETPGWRPRG